MTFKINFYRTEWPAKWCVKNALCNQCERPGRQIIRPCALRSSRGSRHAGKPGAQPGSAQYPPL